MLATGLQTADTLVVRRLPTTPFEPPYDDEVTPRQPPAPAGIADGAGTTRPRALLGRPPETPFAAVASPGEPTSGPPVTADPRPDAGDPFAETLLDRGLGRGRRPVRTARHELPPPCAVASTLVQAVLEVLTGDRSPTQLRAWTNQSVYEGLERGAVRAARRRLASPQAAARPGVVRTVHVSEPSDGVAEVCARVQCGPRARAVALRLEGLDGRWKCTVLQVG